MKRIDKAVLLAAGRGTRMRELTADLPKPMIEVRGKPVLQHIVEGLRDAGVRNFLVIVGYRADAVQNFFGDGFRYRIDIQYATQVAQDGTGRVVDLARDFVSDSAFVLAYGDILVDPENYKRVVDLTRAARSARPILLHRSLPRSRDAIPATATALENHKASKRETRSPASIRN